MRYGYRFKFNLDRVLKNYRYRTRMKDRRLGKPLRRYLGYPSWTSVFYVPPRWKFIVLAPKNLDASSTQIPRIYFYHSTYYFNLTPPSHVTNWTYDPQTNTFNFFHPFSPYAYNHGLARVQALFRSFSVVFFLKIKFKGKGYYIYKNYRDTIAPQFGYAHRVYVYPHSVSVRFLSKTKILLFGLSKQDLILTGHDFKRVKPMNIFTGRGIRFARQVVYKKTGKVSSYR